MQTDNLHASHAWDFTLDNLNFDHSMISQQIKKLVKFGNDQYFLHGNDIYTLQSDDFFKNIISGINDPDISTGLTSDILDQNLKIFPEINDFCVLNSGNVVTTSRQMASKIVQNVHAEKSQAVNILEYDQYIYCEGGLESASIFSQICTVKFSGSIEYVDIYAKTDSDSLISSSGPVGLRYVNFLDNFKTTRYEDVNHLTVQDLLENNLSSPISSLSCSQDEHKQFIAFYMNQYVMVNRFEPEHKLLIAFLLPPKNYFNFGQHIKSGIKTDLKDYRKVRVNPTNSNQIWLSSVENSNFWFYTTEISTDHEIYFQYYNVPKNSDTVYQSLAGQNFYRHRHDQGQFVFWEKTGVIGNHFKYDNMQYKLGRDWDLTPDGKTIVGLFFGKVNSVFSLIYENCCQETCKF